MITQKPLLAILPLLLLSISNFGQSASRTLVKSFNLQGMNQIVLELDGDVEIKEWNNASMRIQMLIELEDGSNSVLHSLITSHRYDLKSRIENNIDGALSSNNQRRNGISLKELAKNGNTCRSLIEKMFYEKFFESERLLIEVHQELSKMGYNYDKTAVSHSLSDMVREGILSRVGTLRNYRYIQKKPLFEK